MWIKSPIAWFLFILCSGSCRMASAQTEADSLSAGPVRERAERTLQAADTGIFLPGKTDSLKAPFQPVPKKAALYSGIFPGLGQIYNRQYWKAPVVYAGAGAAGYFIAFNLDKYRTYRKAYIARLSNEPDGFDYLTDADLKVLQDGYKRYLDMTVLFSVIGYTVQILDALAAAHLKNFDISEDISMRVAPHTLPNNGVGVGLVFLFK